MTKTNNANEFIESFNNIERVLKNKYDVAEHIGFTKLIRDIHYDKKNRIVSNHLRLLESYASLRNAIVHNMGKEFIIAQPNADVVEKIKHIERQIINPPKIMPQYQRIVMSLESSDSIFKAIDLMFKNNYSQMPVYENNKFIGLLNTNTIARWFGGSEKLIDENGSIMIMETKIKDVLKFTEDVNIYKFVNRNFYVHEVLEIFEKYNHIEAVLITHSGDENETLLGIITIWDLVEMNKSLSI